MSSNILYGLLRAATHGTNNNKKNAFLNIEFAENHKTRTKEEKKIMQS